MRMIGYMRLAVLAASLGGLTTIGPLAFATDESTQPGQDFARRVNPVTRMCHDIHLAQQMICHGRDHKRPEFLLLAAEILASTPCIEKTRAADLTQKGMIDRNAPEQLLEEARGMSKTPYMRALADRIAPLVAERARGAEKAPATYVGHVDRKEKCSFRIRFRGGEAAFVTAFPFNGVSDLDLYVYDAATGEMVNSDVGVSPNASVEWFPTADHDYNVVVKHYAGPATGFRLTSN